MKILCITCMNGRPDVSRIFLEGMKRLGIDVLAARSSDESLYLTDEYSVRYLKTENTPLGGKWNSIATAAIQLEWTHLLISGDDNLYSDECLNLWKHNETANYQGLSQLYYIRPNTKEALLLKYAASPPIAIGTGRLLSRVAIEKLTVEGSVKLFHSDQNMSLDHVQDLMLLEQGFYPTIIDRGYKPLCIDIKTTTNMWGFDNFYLPERIVPYNEAIEWVGKKERDLLRIFEPETCNLEGDEP